MVRAVIDHTGFGVADVAGLGRFYDQLLAPLGLKRLMTLPEDGGVGYGVDYPVFWIDRFHVAGRNHMAFAAIDPDQVDAFHSAGLAAGGESNGAPGQRSGQSSEIYYAAFIRDAEGNNIEAVFRG